MDNVLDYCGERLTFNECRFQDNAGTLEAAESGYSFRYIFDLGSQLLVLLPDFDIPLETLKRRREGRRKDWDSIRPVTVAKDSDGVLFARFDDGWQVPIRRDFKYKPTDKVLQGTSRRSDMLDIQHAAAYAKVNERTIRNWISTNNADGTPMLAGVTGTGRLTRIPKTSLDAYARQTRQTRITNTTPSKRRKTKAVKNIH